MYLLIARTTQIKLFVFNFFHNFIVLQTHCIYYVVKILFSIFLNASIFNEEREATTKTNRRQQRPNERDKNKHKWPEKFHIMKKKIKIVFFIL